MKKFTTIAVTLLAAGCITGDCVNGVRYQLLSPDGKSRLVVFNRACGATVGSNTQASVLGRDEVLPDETGNFLTLDQGEAKVSWKPDGGVLVTLDHGSRTFKKEWSIRGIAIECRESDEAHETIRSE
jgi:hypothetical protein